MVDHKACDTHAAIEQAYLIDVAGSILKDPGDFEVWNAIQR
jgi:hypothetical protein